MIYDKCRICGNDFDMSHKSFICNDELNIHQYANDMTNHKTYENQLCEIISFRHNKELFYIYNYINAASITDYKGNFVLQLKDVFIKDKEQALLYMSLI